MKILIILVVCMILYTAKETSAIRYPFEECRWQCDVIDCDYYYERCEYDCYEVCIPFPFLRGQRVATKTPVQASKLSVKGGSLVREENERRHQESYIRTGKSIRMVFANPKSVLEGPSKGRQASVHPAPKSFAITQSCLSDVSGED